MELAVVKISIPDAALPARLRYSPRTRRRVKGHTDCGTFRIPDDGGWWLSRRGLRLRHCSNWAAIFFKRRLIWRNAQFKSWIVLLARSLNCMQTMPQHCCCPISKFVDILQWYIGSARRSAPPARGIPIDSSQRTVEVYETSRYSYTRFLSLRCFRRVAFFHFPRRRQRVERTAAAFDKCAMNLPAADINIVLVWHWHRAQFLKPQLQPIIIIVIYLFLI